MGEFGNLIRSLTRTTAEIETDAIKKWLTANAVALGNHEKVIVEDGELEDGLTKARLAFRLRQELETFEVDSRQSHQGHFVWISLKG